MLEARLDGVRPKSESIRRRLTRADNEEDVNEEDRALHQRIAAEVKRKLEAKGQSTEGVETFEAFYEMLRVEAAQLQREFQFRYCRKKGLILRWSYFVSPSGLVNQVQADKRIACPTKFGRDVDVNIKIAPNNEEDDFAIDFDSMGIDEVMVHVKERDISVARRRGIGGCHDMTEFDKLRQKLEGYDIPVGKVLDSEEIPEVIIRSRVAHASVPGVFLITYGIPAGTAKSETSGEVKWMKDPKTVYDPAEWTDQKLREALKQAITDAASRNGGNIPNTNPTEGTTEDGHKIVYTFRDGKITSFWFA